MLALQHDVSSKQADGRLPSPTGPLSRVMPSIAISSANRLVKAAASQDKPTVPSKSK